MSESEHGTFYWNELYTNDVDKAKAFYADTLGWTYDSMPMEPDGGTYWIGKTGDKPAGGIMAMQGIVPDGVPPHWMGYLSVDDIDARVKKIAQAGGKVLREPFDIPKVGRIAIIEDATGAVIGWITPAETGKSD